jgi:hypothetical protein
MVADRLARLAPGGRSRRIAFVALVALMVTIAGCGGAGPSNNTTGTDGGLDGAESPDEGVGNETEAGDGFGNETETEDGFGNETETEDGFGNETETEDGMNATGTANLRVAHMAGDVDNVDVYLNGDAVLTDVAFGDISDYLEVSPGEYNVTITPAGEDTALFTQDVSVEEGNYSAVAVPVDSATSDAGATDENATETANESAAVDVLVLEDGASDEFGADENATAENASVRVVHASPDAGTVSVVVSGTNTTLVEDASFGIASEYVEVPPGDYSLDIVDENGTVVSTVDVSVEAGTPYTAFAAGFVEGDGAAFEVFLGVDVPESSMMDDGTETDDGETTEETPSEGNTTTDGNTSERLTPLFG